MAAALGGSQKGFYRRGMNSVIPLLGVCFLSGLSPAVLMKVGW